jgi:hypothetical protein
MKTIKNKINEPDYKNGALTLGNFGDCFGHSEANILLPKGKKTGTCLITKDNKVVINFDEQEMVLGDYTSFDEAKSATNTWLSSLKVASDEF